MELGFNLRKIYIGIKLLILGSNSAGLCIFKTLNEDFKDDENKWFLYNK